MLSAMSLSFSVQWLLFCSVPVAIIVYHKNIIFFLLSLLFFFYFPIVIPLMFLGARASDTELVLWTSSLHLIVVVVMFIFEWMFSTEKRYKVYIFYFLITVTLFSFSFRDNYINNYMDEWKYSYRPHQTHILEKSDDNISIVIQNKVKRILNRAMIPKYKKPEENMQSILEDEWKYYRKNEPWQVPDINSLGIDMKSFILLRKLLMQKPKIEFKYQFFTNTHYATVLITSRDRKDLRIIFKFSLKDRWLLESVIWNENYNAKNVKIFGDIKDIWLKTKVYNIAVSDFYKNEFNRSIENFIEAKNDYELFKSRVEYRFALLCIKNFNKVYLPLDYRENRMYEIANMNNKVEELKENKKILETFYHQKIFNEIEKIQNQVLGSIKYSECKKYINVNDLYKVFIKKYLTLSMFSLYRSNAKFNKILKQEPMYDDMEYKRQNRDYLRGYVIREVSALYKNITGKTRKSGIKQGYIMTNESYFTYKKEYLLREDIKDLIYNQELLDFIETQEEIEIRDRFFDSVKADKDNLEMAKKFNYKEHEKKIEKIRIQKENFMKKWRGGRDSNSRPPA